MVLEFAESGSLHDKIKFGYGQLPKPKVKRYFRDVCKAVQYLHSLKYMHRDIKVCFFLCSQKTSSSPKMTIVSYVTLVLQPFFNIAVLFAEPTNIWLPK